VAISEPDARAQTPPGWPLLRLGFRPFYLGAALVACLAVPVWVAAFLGYLQPRLALSPLLWHGHEMLFGFAVGVIIGFLLTGVRAWTGLETPRGPLLGGLILLWLAARVAALTGPYLLFAVLDLLLLPVVAVLLLRVLIRARNKRNMPLISLLLVMTVANLAFHLAAAGVIVWPATAALHAELALIVLVVTVMAGRVVPVFTKNATPGLKFAMPQPFEWTVFGATALTLALWVFEAPAAITAALSALAAVLHAARLWMWHPRVTLRRPILWILHLAYAWMPIAFVLLALTQAGWLANPSLALHAFAVGLIGSLILGMVTRTARGHTGRPLKASGAETLAYVLVLAAAVVRVLVPAASSETYAMALVVAASLWSLAFLIYLAIYAPWLTRTRLDGKDG